MKRLSTHSLPNQRHKRSVPHWTHLWPRAESIRDQRHNSENIGRTKKFIFPPDTDGQTVWFLCRVKVVCRPNRPESLAKKRAGKRPNKSGFAPSPPSLRPWFSSRWSQGHGLVRCSSSSTPSSTLTPQTFFLWTRKKRFLSFVFFCAALSQLRFALTAVRFSRSLTITSLRRRWNTKVCFF